MTIENISWSISTKECCRPRRGLNPRPPGLQSDAHPTAPPRPAIYWKLINVADDKADIFLFFSPENKFYMGM